MRVRIIIINLVPMVVFTYKFYSIPTLCTFSDIVKSSGWLSFNVTAYSMLNKVADIGYQKLVIPKLTAAVGKRTFYFQGNDLPSQLTLGLIIWRCR